MMIRSQEVMIDGVKVHMLISGEGIPLLCLHGWGGSHESFTELRAALKDVPVQVIAVDLPGFGLSGEPPKAWSVDDYADLVERLVEEVVSGKWKEENLMLLLGHSFGGRIAIKLASRGYPWIKHLFLCAAAGIKHKKHIRRMIGIAIAETGKRIFRIPGLRSFERMGRRIFYKLLRVHDYEQASPRMRETMVQVIDEDLTPLLSKITVPTDIFWGTKDRMTPYSDGQKMNTLIVQSVLHTFENVGHRVHRERAGEIAEVIRNYIS